MKEFREISVFGKYIFIALMMYFMPNKPPKPKYITRDMINYEIIQKTSLYQILYANNARVYTAISKRSRRTSRFNRFIHQRVQKKKYMITQNNLMRFIDGV